jgi:hypothetical protein
VGSSPSISTLSTWVLGDWEPSHQLPSSDAATLKSFGSEGVNSRELSLYPFWPETATPYALHGQHTFPILRRSRIFTTFLVQQKKLLQTESARGDSGFEEDRINIATCRVIAVAGSCLSVRTVVFAHGQQVYAVLQLRSKTKRKKPGREV